MLVSSVTRLDDKGEQTLLISLVIRLDAISKSVSSAIGSAMGSTISRAVGSDIGRSMGSSIGKGELTFVFELIENVVRSTVICFSNYRWYNKCESFV